MSKKPNLLSSERMKQDVSKVYVAIAAIVFLIAPSIFASQLASYVDTRIGTAPSPAATAGVASEKAGNTQPAAELPFGMVQWGPDTDHPGSGSYQYSDSHIKGFSLTHLSGAGCPNAGEVSVMPLIAGVSSSSEAEFDHSNELAQAGAYSVKLKDGIQVELTATTRTGEGRFTFPNAATPAIKINVDKAATGSHSGSLQQNNATTVSGWAMGGNFCATGELYKIYFSMKFDHPIQSMNSSSNGDHTLIFQSQGNSVLNVNVGISYVSVENAQANLQAENPSFSFDSALAAAQLSWERFLSAVEVSGGTDVQNRTFYTALYHSLLFPSTFSDVDGSYMGFDKKIHSVSQSPGQSAQYANFSGWDIYRSEIQLQSFLFPSIASDIVQSLVNDADQCGALPKWANNNVETSLMVGDPGSLIVANAYAFGATEFDTRDALQLMIKSGTVPGTSCNGHAVRPNLDNYLKQGYVPTTLLSLLHNSESASVTLEYASADYAVSQFAKSMGDEMNAQKFLLQSNSWKNIFDSGTGYIRPKYSDGKWLSFFNISSQNGFAEGDSAQYTWMVPFDLSSLIQQIGGPFATRARLDSFFQQLNAWRQSPNLWIGNEPAFDTPWVYNWTGNPDLSQNVISRILSGTFSDQAGGLPGNDDLGATSSWYVWASLGLYPAVPGVGGFTLGRPHFPQITMGFENGTSLGLNSSFTDSAQSADDVIQSVVLNNAPLDASWISWSDLKNGAQMNFTLGPNSVGWATNVSELP